MTEFISHWRTLYNYGDESMYKQNIGLLEFNRANLTELYHWKNGMTLVGSGVKEKSLDQKILNKIPTINEYKKSNNIDLVKFNIDFDDVSAVWRIFLLHIIKPSVYPIYDQHIHRAYNFIHGLEWKSINNKMKDKIKFDFYYNTYLPYVHLSGIKDLKAMDEAFFAFGQFLKTRNQSQMLLNQ